MNEAQTRILSHSVMCKESNEDDTKETLQTNKQKSTHEYSGVVLVNVHMLQVYVHFKHVVVLCVIDSVVVSDPTFSLFACM